MADLLYQSQYFTTTLSVAGGIDASQTTGIVLQAVSGVSEPTKPGLCLLSYADPLDTTKAEWITYTSVNTTTKALVGVTRAQEGSSGKTHANGVTVAFPHSKTHINRINDKLNGVDTDGVRLIEINDANGNEELKFTATTSAVNELTLANAATGNKPTISATGGDTNIGIEITPKGTGALTVGGNPIQHGAWTAWTPTWTNVTIGNATVVARYTQIGKTIIAHLSFTFGSTTSISGSVAFSLPVAGTNDVFANSVFIGTCYAEDNGVSGYTAFIRQGATTAAYPVSAGNGAFFNTTAPFTWAAGDFFRCTFMYEAA